MRERMIGEAAVSTLAFDKVRDPKGVEYDVSTIRTFAGGAPARQPLGSPFSTADFEGETPWPFETMVFRSGSRKGLHHSPHASEEAAIGAHARMVEAVRSGADFEGGVQGKYGTPALSAEEWRKRRAVPPP